jgi:hypothetical protein
VTIARARIVVCQPATVGGRRTDRPESGAASLAREFPSVSFDVEVDSRRAGSPLPTIEIARWNDRRHDFWPFDGHVEDLAGRGPVTLVVRGSHEEACRAAHEMLTRWQRLLDRRNAASRLPEFGALLVRLRALHDLSKPLVRADWNHALDTWQWMLRLQPSASGAAQMAALMHDIERLESEADVRVEHLAPNYASFKNNHAARGAQMVRAILDACGVGGAAADRVASLVAGHERPDRDPERALLNDADALSFFSQNSAGYLDYFGVEQARRKIAYSLERMGRGALARLTDIRMRADVACLVDEVRSGQAAAPHRHTPGARDGYQWVRT